MTNKLLGGIVLIVMLLSCSSCEKLLRMNYRITGTVSEEGQWRQADAKELLPKDIYVSDALVINCSGTLFTSAPFTQTESDPFHETWTQIIPDSLTIAWGNFISVDTVAEKIYFCANKGLYSCSYSGEDLIKHALDLSLTFINPVLSADRRYITMLNLSSGYNQGKLNRYDLQTSELLHLEQPGDATWAAYNPELDKFYYFSSLGALHSINPDGSDEVSHFEGFRGKTWEFCQSNKDRYIGAFSKASPNGGTGMVFDISTGEVSLIENLDRMAFNPCKNELSYSIRSDAKAKLYRRNLDDGSEVLIHNGRVKKPDKIATYLSLNYRQDGKSMLFTAMVATPLTAGLYDE
ncbi:MAG: hypothetical protein PHR32_07890 [Candidatus Cloacimonetes bacterium]|nr:hypothetical protein [Candidatus Cloacimonadota bacterium]